MSDKYYRGLKSTIDDVKNKLQLASMTLKINENKNSISRIKNDISEINNFSDKINDNETNISDNLGKINDNTNNIASNSEQINTNTSSILTNLKQINTNTLSISTNSEQISTNTSSITTNLGKINTNKSDIDEINSNLSNIDFNSGNKYSIENFFIYNIEIEKSYNLNKDKNSFTIFKYNLEDNFKKNSILEIDCRLLYRYNNYNHIGYVHHIFKLYDNNDNMIYNYKSLITNSGDNTRNDIKQNDFFYFKLNNDYKIIKIELILSLINNVSNTTSVDCRLYNDYKSNFINIKYYKKINLISVNNNLGDIENSVLTNKNNISTNLIKINSNEDDILNNLNEINYIKNNKSTQYLKNVYNILIYDSKTQIDFRKDIFYEKIFDVDANQNDFLEIFFKIQLEYRDTDDRHYVKSIYELFDENNNSLYIKSVNNNDYAYFSNKMTIDENIFYNFTNNIKKLKFVIKFQKLSSTRVVYLYYIKNNNNNRLIVKHYGN